MEGKLLEGMGFLGKYVLFTLIGGCAPYHSLEQCHSLDLLKRTEECQRLLWRERVVYLEREIEREVVSDRRGLLRVDLEQAYYDGLTYYRRFGAGVGDEHSAMSLCIRAQANARCLGNFGWQEREVQENIASLCESKGWWF